MKMNIPTLTTDLKMPKILWYQTDYHVNLRIQLIDVDKYYLRVDREQLHFSTIVNDTKYYVIINLFGAVIAERTITTKTEREVRIKIFKGHLGTDWLRLQIEQEKSPMIQIDPDRMIKNEPKEIKYPVNYEAGELVAAYKKLNNIKHIYPDEPSSDEGESEDEIFDSYFD
ncbi:uncharacterized protein LOC122499329 [Leptopilina heterotoma]|uniref:uncharacterized protein LOC122499329 n=1 Tax=Leptopilina heterotoma TaxID=63436 RepID=UPI001CA83E63|nr:uncharacterized protein LOC122499329 [Leptopilina heterotoma]